MGKARDMGWVCRWEIGTGTDSLSIVARSRGLYRRTLCSRMTGLQDGKLDRSQLTSLCDAYFTAEAMGDFAASLKPLGVPTSFKQVGESKRGGMTFRVFSVSFPEKQVRITVYEMPDGKLEQYLVIPTGS